MIPDTNTLSQWLIPCIRIAREAGDLILKHYEGDRAAEAKADRSPVTEADIAANTLIVEGLQREFSMIPVISEEDSESIKQDPGNLFWLVDPLDGTRSYVEGSGEFSVNIGLVYNGAPILGVLLVPVPDKLYYAYSGGGAFLQDQKGEPVAISCRAAPDAGITVVRSKSHPSPATNEFLNKFEIADIQGSSSAAKFGMVAEGAADLYPRLGRTMEWDTAAGHAIILEAGGVVLTAEGTPLTYGKPGFDNPAFVAYGDKKLIAAA